MKPAALLCLLALLSVPASADMLLVGILNVDGAKMVTLRDSAGGESSAWLAEGASFRNFKVLEVRPVESQVLLEKDGAKFVVLLQDSKVGAAKPEVAKEPAGEFDKLSNEDLHAKGLYRLGRGDSGAKIAKCMGVSLSDLQKLNPGVNWARLKIGQIVRFKMVE